ncbi:hypothetical protein PSM7751_03698 [Pseudooceanicola marinus]|uniref:Uncharacterized protein n=1 Tax=Pseudooceanicola marinus TaxID=396013 RepID=A0A1X7A6M0_9RHOB|nr:hypothetical protein [Pseudooceanicola marinus]PJE27133.1 hypothetical protein CVM50_17105 [Pseudooceanicola marinus]SLN70182.1 hypothetical protein PSM7751_03698 [Pseudooceanicola marinus]
MSTSENLQTAFVALFVSGGSAIATSAGAGLRFWLTGEPPAAGASLGAALIYGLPAAMPALLAAAHFLDRIGA